MLKRIACGFCILLVSACSTLPTPSQEETADYGSYPDNYQNVAKAYLMKELRDPSTIEIGEITRPKKQWIGDKFTGVKYGYLVCAKVNSKNLLGKMTGYRSDAVLIRDGVVIDHVQNGELFSGIKLCD
jgi:hypothetical protein